MTTVLIEDNSPQAQKLLEYIATLPFAKVERPQKKSFEEAIEECKGVPVSVFISELRRQCNEYFDHNA